MSRLQEAEELTPLSRIDVSRNLNESQQKLMLAPGNPPACEATLISHRIIFWDVAKGVAIITIVFGHVLGALRFEGRTSFVGNGNAISCILLSALATFYFVSGAFLRNVGSQSFPTFVTKKVVTLAIPYVLGTVVQGGFEAMLSRWVVVDRGFKTLLVTMWYAPYWQFWFLYVLFLASVLTWLLLRVGLRPWAVLAIAIAMRCVADRFETLGWQPLTRLFADYVYVAVGTCVGKNFNDRIESLSRVSLSLAGLAACSAFLAIARVPAGPALALTQGVIGTVVVVVISAALVGTAVGTVIASVGRHSLAIFSLHVLVIGGLKVFAIHLAPDLPGIAHLLLRAGGGILIPLGIGSALSKYRMHCFPPASSAVATSGLARPAR